MGKKEKHIRRKKEWQKPDYKSLKFNHTFGGAISQADEGTYGTAS